VRSRYRRFSGLLGLALVVLLLASVLLTHSQGAAGIAPGQRFAPFATPLALGSLEGDADIATHANDGSDGRVPACAERGPRILNICQLYEQGPVVLALFVDSGSCADVLDSMQALVGEFPGVRFAAVAIRGERDALRKLIRERGLTLPVGIDSDGAVAALYKVFSCPQVDFAFRGGVVQSKALLGNASVAALRARVRELATAAQARERRGAGA
jgi:peroxiredoxin